MDEVVVNLKACLITTKGGISINRLNKDYMDVVGERIPYRRLNYASLEDFVNDIPGLKKSNRGGELFIEAIPTAKTAHIHALVQGQKNSKKSRKRVATSYNRARPTFSNSRNSCQQRVSRPPYSTQSSRTPSYAKKNNDVFHGTRPTTQSDTDTRGLKLREVGFERPKSNLQDRLINQPKSNETANVRVNSPSMKTLLNDVNSSTSTTHINETRPSISMANGSTMFSIPIRRNFENRENEDLNVIRLKANSMVPFDEFNQKKTPEEELRLLALSLNDTAPVYKISKAKHRSFFASVTVGKNNFSCYPDSGKTEEEAKSMAIAKALQELKKKEETCSLPTTKDTKLIEERILKIIDTHSTGVFTTQLLKYYMEEYKELLPQNVCKIINSCEFIKEEKGANDTTILTRFVPTTEEKESEELAPLSPFNKLRISSSDGQLSSSLTIPEDKYWVTHVTFVYSTSEIMVQIVGEEYSERFEKMSTEMNEFYLKNLKTTKVTAFEEDVLYAYFSQQERKWYRVRCLDVNMDLQKALVDFIDFGDDEVCDLSMLYKLDKQFCVLPAQALCLSLNELEIFSLNEIEEIFDSERAKTIIANHLMDAEFYVEVKYIDDGTPSVVFYDTRGETDVNLNRVMATEIVETCMKRPKLKTASLHEVYVSHVSEAGEVFIQFKDNSMFYLVELMNKVIEKLSDNYSQYAVKKLDVTKLYIAKSNDEHWYRVRISSIVDYSKEEISVLCVDFGKTMTVKITDLVNLDVLSDVLCIYPVQAVKVQLSSLLTLDTEKLERLRKLTPPGQLLIMKVVQLGLSHSPMPIVELFKRQEPNNEIVSINNTLLLDAVLKKCNGDSNNNVRERKRSERTVSRHGSSSDQGNVKNKRILRQPEIPKVDSQFDIHVVMVCNPGNFIIQPYESKKKLQAVNEQLFKECNNYSGEPLTMDNVHEDSLYCVRHSDNFWYRVCVLNKLMAQNMVTVYFVDYGEVTLVNLKNLRPLPTKFLDLPYQAIRAKLADVKPANVDWSPEDSVRFKDLIEGKDFVSTIKNIKKDGEELVLSLALIDVSKEYNVNIDEILIKEGRAKSVLFSRSSSESFLNSSLTK
ncbi:tudor domain-containing protein 7B [Leptopilina heterotoma]|uniref:tudor domain-containing protein 7B n=1 Tax=Leptopilina heterotoma TaxID=63436 RepID=UPI001CA7BDAB|nr:tudor domain-containing protein 7B [Leptopilina heterotoma]XP_043469099.1 tudor domain-containing protein 7B [Leptopilina heterotoma]